MRNRRLKIRGGGHIRIDREWLSPSPAGFAPDEPPVVRSPAPAGDTSTVSNRVALGSGIIERAEIITEGVFRPGVDDVEVKYLMSGGRPDRVDRLHPLASDRIISEATPVSVVTNVSQMIEFVKRSGAEDAGLIVDLHTHPSSGIALPSDTDMKTWRSMAQLVEEEFPNARFLFGVHGVGAPAAAFMERTSPRIQGVNRLTWRSNTRDHEIALFTADSSPIEVQLIG